MPMWTFSQDCNLFWIDWCTAQQRLYGKKPKTTWLSTRMSLAQCPPPPSSCNFWISWPLSSKYDRSSYRFLKTRRQVEERPKLVLQLKKNPNFFKWPQTLLVKTDSTVERAERKTLLLLLIQNYLPKQPKRIKSKEMYAPRPLTRL